MTGENVLGKVDCKLEMKVSDFSLRRKEKDEIDEIDEIERL